MDLISLQKCRNPLTVDVNRCPAYPPPPGVLPMDPHAYSLRPQSIVAIVVCLSVAACTLIVRLYTKIRILKVMYIEDYVLIFAFMGFLVFTGFVNEAFVHNCGKHDWDISIADAMMLFKYVNFIQITYAPAMFLTKLGLLLQIRRIFASSQRDYSFYIIWMLIIGNALAYTAVFFTFLFACLPREKIWNPTIPGRCVNSSTATVATSAFNLASDVTILMVPLLGVWSINMPRKRKLAVSGIFATGFLAIAACIGRLVTTVKTIHSHDGFFVLASSMMWALAEFATAFVCVSLPTFPRFFASLSGRDVSKTPAYEDRPVPSRSTRLASRSSDMEITIRELEHEERWDEAARDDRDSAVELHKVPDKAFARQYAERTDGVSSWKEPSSWARNERAGGLPTHK